MFDENFCAHDEYETGKIYLQTCYIYSLQQVFFLPTTLLELGYTQRRRVLQYEKDNMNRPAQHRQNMIEIFGA